MPTVLAKIALVKSFLLICKWQPQIFIDHLGDHFKSLTRTLNLKTDYKGSQHPVILYTYY